MQIALTHKGQAALWVTNGCTSMSNPITTWSRPIGVDNKYTIFEDSSLNSSGENCYTNLAVKDGKWTNKEKNKSKESDSQSHDTTTHCPCVY